MPSSDRSHRGPSGNKRAESAAACGAPREEAGFSACAAAVDGEKRRRIRQAIIKELSLADRLLLVLCYVERMTVGEIACVMDMTREQVLCGIQRIEDRLRREIASA